MAQDQTTPDVSAGPSTKSLLSHETLPRERFALAAALFLITGVNGFLQPFLPLYLNAAGLTKSRVGLVLALGTGAALLIQPLLGRLSDKWDARRPIMACAAVFSAVAYLCFRFAHSLPAFIALTALGVNGFAYLNAAGGVLVGRLAQSGRGGAAYVGYRVWGSVGYVVIGMTTGWLINRSLPPQATLSRASLEPVFTYGPLLFFAIAAIVAWVPDRKRLSPARPVDGEPEVISVEDNSLVADRVASGSPSTGRAGDNAAGDSRSFKDDRRLQGEPQTDTNLNAFLLSFFLYQLALYGASSFLPFYMKQLGASPGLITAMFAGGVVSEVLVMTRIGRWTDIYGRRPALAFSFLLMPIRLLMYIPAHTPAWVMAVQTLHGLNFGIIGTIAVVFVNDLAGDHERGAKQARLAAAQGMGTAVGPILCGWLSDHAGLQGMFALMSAIGFVAAGLFLTRVRESHTNATTHRNRAVRWLAG